MIAAIQPDDFGYRLLFLLHMVSMVVGFGATFVFAFAGPRAGKLGGKEGYALSKTLKDASKALATPFIYATGLWGLLLVALAEPWDWDETWINVSLGLFVIGAVCGYLLSRNQSAMLKLQEELLAGGPPPGAGPGAAQAGPPPQVVELQKRGKRQGMLGGFTHLIFLAIVVMMIWKPGA